ncbi:TlpA family protein disulfide reductase [Dyadobacter aurulentus]|uniref:TlpA family protein disulfide reductase n=1 Tax=Dyadobacter sp. UC 10 TaxID=2605428 RepID=UPI0011F194A3|nr:thioredoxin-like domain-containing protein [Dyadobacter sp. UC 10]KAA0992829.1 redoxin family protein [Dyadobacter sp. UC 10]
MKRYIFLLWLCATTAFSQRSDFLVTISGTTNDSTINEVVLSKNNPFLDIYQPVIISKSYKNKRNEFTLKCNIENAQILNLYANRKSWKIFVSPGSNQQFSILNDGKNKTITFSGKDAGNSTFLNELNDYLKINKIKAPSFSLGSDEGDYQVRVDNFYNKMSDFLKNFTSAAPINKALITKLLAYQYQSLLEAPLRKNPQAKLSAGYVKDLLNLQTSDSKMIDYEYFTDLLRSRFILSKSKPSDIRANFGALHKDINQHTKGKARDFLLSSLIGFYVTNASSTDTSKIFESVFKNALDTIKDTTYHNYLESKYIEYSYLNKQFPDKVLDETILIRYRDKEKMTLRKVLNEYKMTSVYVDFWASWCAPCRYDIQESKESKAFLADKKIHLIYLSIDKDQKSWEKAVEEENIMDNQYLVQSALKSEIVNHYSIYAIPRYFFLDQNHLLQNAFAPRLGKAHLESVRKAVENEKIQITTYK